MAIVTIRTEIDDAKLWSAVWGSEPGAFDWWVEFDFQGEADWDKPGINRVRANDPNDDTNTIIKDIGVDELVAAYEKVRNLPAYHCFGHLVGIDLEDFDACEGDCILQMAMFGEIVYG